MKEPRIDLMRFPGGLSKALTFSYDDGVLQDKRLLAILNRNGLKGTFNLGSAVLGKIERNAFGGSVDISKVAPGEVAELYAGHEVAGHGLFHSSLTGIGSGAALYEIIEDRKRLEDLIGGMVRGFAYPGGSYSEDAKQMLKYAGYEYARIVPTTGTFAIPNDFYEWSGTAHHNDPNLMQLAHDFFEGDKRMAFRAQLFYLWGHAYEFDQFNNWNVIEDFASYAAQFADSTWFATNIEICDYVKSFRKLIYSADASRIYNPTCITLWLANRRDVYKIEPGETVTIKE